MTLELRTFHIRDGAAEDDEARLASFLRSVEIVRIDTAYADGAWRVLVHYEDSHRTRERARIEGAILDALNAWRAARARERGVDREAVLTQALAAEIARYAPTSEVELSVIADALGAGLGGQGAEIVRIVREVLDPTTKGPAEGAG